MLSFFPSGRVRAGPAKAMWRFAFDLKPGIRTAEFEALVAKMKRVITHVHFEGPPVDP